MTLEAEGGGGVELGAFSLKTLVGIAASLDGIQQQLSRLRRYEEAYQFGAVEIALRGAGQSSSGGATLAIDLGGPSYGRLWQIRRVAIGGALWTSTVAGSALIVVSPNQVTAPPMSDVADQAATLPNVGFYSTGQLIVRHPNHLFVVILTPTVSTVYGVGGAATDLPDSRHPITVPD